MLGQILELAIAALLCYGTYKFLTDPGSIVRDTSNSEDETVLIEEVTDDDEQRVIRTIWRKP